MRSLGKVRALGAVVAMAAMFVASAGCKGGGGSGDGGSAGAGGTGSGGMCGPYPGSYSGIFTFKFSCVNDPSMNGLGTILVHFTAACAYVSDDGIHLEITSLMSDSPVLGSLTKTDLPDGTGGIMVMPKSLPATSGPDHYISLVFPKDNHILDTRGEFTVGTGAAKIGSDPDNHDAFLVGDDVTSAAGRPDGCVVDSKTFKIDKD